MKLPVAVLLAGALAISQSAHADKIWNANPNPDINKWISGMYASIDGPLGSWLQICQTAQAVYCQVVIQANRGVNTSDSDVENHFTVRFTGSHTRYDSCHIYPKDPGNVNNKSLRGANCYAPGHVADYYKLK
ncbi:hypothetical protein [Dyella acidiphila]|uniref:Uncharacterized protein n=1 Tax=Dyella acidiphila TaxID=2775866 RepID=A0ABR9G785_9GAMM|nr:hypothetical protein [Dyella acidiphila]MBE1159891.1 hypothetical protein [Dyella acidiphila]